MNKIVTTHDRFSSFLVITCLVIGMGAARANQAPVTNDDSAFTNEDVPVNIDVLGNDSDSDNDPLSVISFSNPTNGWVEINAVQSVNYIPNDDFYGGDSFTYTISDNNGGQATATVNITVAPVNDPPVAISDTTDTNEDVPVIVSVQNNDFDVDGDFLTVSSVSNSPNGSAVVNPDQTVTYTPAPDFNGNDVFTYTISDNNGGQATATVNITVAPVNDPPVAVDDHASTAGDTSVSISVLDNDLDADGDSLTVSIVSNPHNGSALVNQDQTVIYTPDPNFIGTDVFDYAITDGKLVATATVSVDSVYQGDDLWIPLNEHTGSLVMEAGGTILGPLSGFADSDAARVPGIHGNALSFDGSDDQVTLSGIPASTLPTGSEPRTVMCWIRVPQDSALEKQAMFSYGSNTAGGRFTFRLTAESKLCLEVTGGLNITGTKSLDDGQWHHVAAVCDDFNGAGGMNVDETKLYVDGTLEVIGGSSSQVMNTAIGSTAILGASAAGTDYNFAGEIDELRLFPVAMAQEQVQAQMNAANQIEAAWHRKNFGSAPVNWSADTDGDEANRLSEFAFGGNPHIADAEFAEPTIVLNQSTSRLEVSFPRRTTGSHNLLYTVDVSNDLLDWGTLTATEIGHSIFSLEDCLERVTFETDATISTEARQFTRVTIELLP
jgi:hypothetical protein